MLVLVDELSVGCSVTGVVFATEDDDEDDVMVIKKDKGSKRLSFVMMSLLITLSL